VDTKNLNKLKKIIKFCQENGIKRVKMADFEIELAESSTPAKPLKIDSSDIIPKKQTLIPTEQDFLFFSVDGYPIEDENLPKN
jgi:hypothetical protein